MPIRDRSENERKARVAGVSKEPTDATLPSGYR